MIPASDWPCLVTYADEWQGHNGSIYRADNWDSVGTTKRELAVLNEHIENESIDLVYLDPPFNSKANYNILFGGNGKSQAQIRAFDDTWHWGDESERSYADVLQYGGKPADVLEAFRGFLGDNDMMAYLAMMAPRLIKIPFIKVRDTGGQNKWVP